MSKCATWRCKNELAPNAITNRCDTCRAWMHRMLKRKRSEQIEYVERQERMADRTQTIFNVRKDLSDTSSIEPERLQAEGVMIFKDVDKNRVAAIQKREGMKQKGHQVVVSIKERERRRA